MFRCREVQILRKVTPTVTIDTIECPTYYQSGRLRHARVIG